MSLRRHVVVFGGFGALGKNLIRNLKKKNFIAISIDLKENSEADHSILLPSLSSSNNNNNNNNNNNINFHSGELSQQVIEKALQTTLSSSSSSLDAVINVAGGFMMGDLKETCLLSQVDSMWKVSVQSSFLSALCASKFLREDGLLVLPGAAGALGKTPVTLAYGVAKSSVHHLVKSFADPEQCGLPKGTTTVGIVPSMLDTEANRQAMPNADFSSWTPLDHVSEKIVDWIECKERPVSGSLIKIVTENGKTQFENV